MIVVMNTTSQEEWPTVNTREQLLAQMKNHNAGVYLHRNRLVLRGDRGMKALLSNALSGQLVQSGEIEIHGPQTVAWRPEKNTFPFSPYIRRNFC